MPVKITFGKEREWALFAEKLFSYKINNHNHILLDISTNQKLQVENIMKKVLGVAFMPEELAGRT